MRMKINNIRNIDKFFEVVDACKGKVMLTSPEGDCINLKSQLSKYIAFSSVFNDVEIKELELKCELPKDTDRMLNYMVNR